MIATDTAPAAAEAAVLYAVLTDPPCIADIADTLTPDDFGATDHRHIFAAMLACHGRGQRPDVVTVGDELTAAGHAGLTSEPYRIITSVDAWVSSAYVTDYAHRVAAHSRRRAVIAQATNLIAQLHNDPDTDPIEAAHAALADLNRLGDIDGGPRLYADVIEDMQQRLTDQRAGLWEDQVLPTGLADLDRLTGGGFRPGELIILGGRPGSGKTALLLQIAHNVARAGAPALVFSGEMGMPSLVERGLAEITGLSMADIRRRDLSEYHYTTLMDAAERMRQMPVGIDDTSGLTTAQMLIRAQRFQRKHGLGLVVFDYLELAGDQSKQGETQRLSQISRGMKHLARTLDVPVLALSQLSRNVESRTPPTPRMSDLRQSGGIEADADIVMLLYRHEYYVQQGMADFDPDKAHTADLYIGKQRNGSTGTVTLFFDEPTMRFRNLTRGDA